MDAWLVGTGPSLDTYDWNDVVDGYIICINFAYKVVPRFNSLCVLDTHRIGLFSDLFDKGIPLYAMRARTLCKRHFNVKDTGYIIPGAGNSSSAVGLCVLWNMGFRRIHLVGFDSMHPEHPTCNHAENLIGLGCYKGDDMKLTGVLADSLRKVIAARPELELIYES